MNEIYITTPLGIAVAVAPESFARAVIDAIALHMMRHYGPTPGIVLEDGQLRFVRLERREADHA